MVDAAGPGGDLPRPRDREAARGGGGVEVGVAGQQAHVADGGLGVLAAEVVLGGEPGGGGGVPVRVVVVVGVEPPQDPVGRRRQQGGDHPELLQRLAAGGTVKVTGGRGVQVDGGRSGGPQRIGDAGEAAAGGGQGASGPVWRAHHEPPPLRWVARGGWCAGRPPRMRSGVLLARVACLSLQNTRLIDANQIDIGRSFVRFLSATPSTGNRGAGWSQPGPFDKTGLICLGILGTATDRP